MDQGVMTSIVCCMCGQRFSERDPKPLGEDGGRCFDKPADGYVCFWCVGDFVYDPSDPAVYFQVGHA
jgi:hypothetical protein